MQLSCVKCMDMQGWTGWKSYLYFSYAKTTELLLGAGLVHDLYLDMISIAPSKILDFRGATCRDRLKSFVMYEHYKQTESLDWSVTIYLIVLLFLLYLTLLLHIFCLACIISCSEELSNLEKSAVHFLIKHIHLEFKVYPYKNYTTQEKILI